MNVLALNSSWTKTPGICINKDGQIEAKAGTAESPDLTIATPFEIWMDIMTGKADGQQMFMDQKYTVIGDIELLIKMSQWFGS